MCGRVWVKFGLAAGGRKTCQDMAVVQRLSVLKPGHKHGVKEWLLVCLCDGHGEEGHKVSAVLRRLLPPMIQREIRKRGLKKR